MAGLAEFALAGAPVAGGALLALAAGNFKGPDVRGSIKADMELLAALPPSRHAFRPALALNAGRSGRPSPGATP